MQAVDVSHRVVSKAEWTEARKALLAEEKELTRQRDAVSRRRRQLPWVRVGKKYVFDGPEGKESLGELFAGRSQLIIYHFMLGPGWKEGCVGCSFRADHMEGAIKHLEHHDVSFVVVSRAPLAEIEAFRQRMGWRFKWVSSYGSNFNYDYHVSFTKDELAQGEAYYNYETRAIQMEEMAGTSVFYQDATDDVFHTYSQYARGGDIFLGAYNYLDITPKGRNENGPHFAMTDWVRHHDRYDDGGDVDRTGHYVASQRANASCGCGEEHA